MAQASATIPCILPETSGHPTFSSVSCHPDILWSWWEVERGQLSKTVWSLGPFECPELYTTATVTEVAAEQVEVVCCPSQVQVISTLVSKLADYCRSYTFVEKVPRNNAGQCMSPLKVGQEMVYTTNNSIPQEPPPTAIADGNDRAVSKRQTVEHPCFSWGAWSTGKPVGHPCWLTESQPAYTVTTSTITAPSQVYAFHVNGRNLVARPTVNATNTTRVVWVARVVLLSQPTPPMLNSHSLLLAKR
ncbi:hypothetical protein GLAREA_10607 [Glarea lozoyensis ATCC 20868]|uniref:Uncharacterized protein n=1 Tax=Glarea lozoyensis (strain ATCC 20868 / MF5171) TaxID=1116229 RepID=S3D8X4_GLAL2|nr:uncharacterized protein GLAREA_10607 [Glarea lozoyensis ATCC 20868]EPE34912.1 hypothetical protein GLAREA_10607 [Glarea lozoyensis ATCC 20868]